MQTKRLKYANAWAATAFLAPFMMIYLWFWVYPIFRGFLASLYTGSFSESKQFTGFDNYRLIMSDSKFWSSLWNTLYFIVISTPSIVVAGLAMALLVNSKLKGTTLLRTAYFMPYMLSVSVVGSIWVFILQSRTGLFAETMRSLGVTTEISWFGSWSMGWLSILIATLWWTVGFNMILFLAGLQEIPDDLYEAADLDGAGSTAKFRYITLPSLKGVTALVVILQTIASFKLFGQTWLITKGGPGTATTPLVHYIYQVAFRQWNTGYAAAISFVLFAVIAFVSVLQYRIMSGRQGR